MSLEWLRERFGIPVITSPGLPQRVVLITNPPDLFREPPMMRFVPDPWPDSSLPPRLRGSSLRGVYEVERRKALEHLADRLDGLCEHFGMDPDEAWRRPKLAEQQQRDHRAAYIAEARIGFAVMDPAAAARIVVD